MRQAHEKGKTLYQVKYAIFPEYLQQELKSPTVIDPSLKSWASAELCESICGFQKRTGRFNRVAYNPVRQNNRSYNS